MNYEQIAASLRATARELELSEARAGSVDHLNKVLSQANNSLAAQIKELQAAEHSAKCKAEVATEVARSLGARVRELETYSHAAATTIDALRAEIENRKEAAELLSVDRQVVDQKLAGAENTIQDLRAENDNLREASAEKDLRLSQWQEHAAGLRASLHNHVMILDDKIKRIAELEKRVTELDCLVPDLNQNAVRTVQAEAAAKKHKEHADCCEAAWVRERNLRFELERQRDAVATALDLLKQRIYPQEKENYILKMNMRGRRDQILSLQNDLAAVTRERDGLARILGGLVKMVQPPNV